jgi:tRNA threonylcarbamoyladenosine biosynthesis protein TsaB
MLILGIDTSEEIGVITLGKDSQLLAEYHFHCRMSLLRRLIPNVERVMSDAGQSVSDLGGIAICLGPGSFTGLRIGVTTAKSLAYTLRKPIEGIGTHDAIAVSCGPSTTHLICPMTHARAGEVYWSLFDSTGEVRLEDPVVGPISEAFDAIAKRGGSALFCGSGAARNAEAIRHRFGAGALVGKPWTSFARGAAIIQIATHKFRDGLADDPMTLVPLYIRKPTPVVRLETGEFEHSTSPPGGEGRGEDKSRRE